MSCLPITALILAAGTASRMGKLKQNLPFEGSTLLRHAIRQATRAEFSRIFVVVGAHANEVQASIARDPVDLVLNPDWQKGMGTSIVAGMRQIRQADEDFAGVAMLAGDQPLVTGSHLREMVNAFIRQPVDIVAAEYSQTVGIPAVFGRKMFGRLLQLPSSAGAKSVLQDPSVRLLRFALPEAATDVDTPEDWSRLLGQLP